MLFFSQGQHLIYDTIFYGLVCTHEEIALCIALDALQGLTCVMLNDLVAHITSMENLASLNINIGCLPTYTALLELQAELSQRGHVGRFWERRQ